ncbi:MbnH family di-heme enzyme [Chitiniphilus shinanonensis]|uniref:MbnH family di-heme enzyme n=1 Tax=Chitiniphilus shinanonensis TaxID=553088 RepID=UPI003021C91F
MTASHFVRATWLAALLPLALAGCGGGGGTTVVDETPGSGAFAWQLPAFFPAPAVPEANPMNDAKVELGRRLFYDVRLSGNGTQACASCHQQDKAFTDGRRVALGSTGEPHPRNAQGLANVVFNPTLTWANPVMTSLERQMEVPLFGVRPVEMGINDANKDEVLGRIAGDGDYPARFATAFAGEAQPVNWGNIVKAIAAFQRTILSGNSRYDQYLSGKATLSSAELRGMQLFFGEKAECFHCHGSFNFNDQTVHAASRFVETPFHNTGLYNLGGTGAFPEPNVGLIEFTRHAADMGKFRAPSLRNVEVTAPYMHDGSVGTLEEVLAFYAAGGRNIVDGPYAGDGRANPYKDELITRISLTQAEIDDLIAFLKTLTDHELLTNPKLADPFRR